MEQFFCKTRIVSGSGSLSCLSRMHIARLLIVTDPYFSQNGTARQIAALTAGETAIFDRVAPDPSVALVAEGTKMLLEFQPDSVLALGGGSAMDCAKAMVFFSGQQPRLIAVPTTSGSGSEVTDFAILTHDGVKHPLVDDSLRPDVAILDDSLLSSLPRALIADTGFDLISHALEAWAATGANGFSDALAADALAIALKQLPRSFSGDTAARLPVHQAATMAGIAFSSAGLGLCHALSHALGGAFHTPHGRLNAILLPAVLDVNAEKSTTRYAILSRRLGLSSGNDALALRALKNALVQLRRQLCLPATLSEAGIAPAALRKQQETLIAAALADPCCESNPLKVEAHHIRAVFSRVMGHG